MSSHAHTVLRLCLFTCAAAFFSSPAAAQEFDFTCSIVDGILVDADGNPADATKPCYPAELEGIIGNVGPNGLAVTPGAGTGTGGTSSADGTGSTGDATTPVDTPPDENGLCYSSYTTSGLPAGDPVPCEGDTGTDPVDPGDEPEPLGSVIIAGVLNGGDTAYSVLRLASLEDGGGLAQIAVVDPADGEVLGIWNNFELDRYGSVQIDVAAALSEAFNSPAGSTAGTFTLPSVIDLHISSGFNGSVQHLIGNTTDGLLINASACGANATASDRIPYIPADTVTVQSWVRIVTIGSEDAAADVLIRDAVTGVPAAIWISEPVPAGGSLMVDAATIREQAAIDAGLSSLGEIMIDPATFPDVLRLELVATSNITGAVTDQTISCTLPDTLSE